MPQSTTNTASMTRAESAAVQERSRLVALQADISTALIKRDVSMEEMLRACCEAIALRLSAAFARVWTLSPDGKTLELRASAGLYTHVDGGHSRVPVGKFKIGLIAEERKPHLTNKVVGDSRVHNQEWAKEQGMVAFAGHPLMVDERVVGVMAMFSQHELPETTLSALGTVANAIALGIDRKLSEATLRLTNRQLQESNEQLDHALLFLEQRVHERTAELEREVSERQRAEEDLRVLTGRVLQLQDEERRRIARDLHDSSGQLLVAIGMHLGLISKRATELGSDMAGQAAECRQLIDQLSRELRTVSYLLHPPMLDEAGLGSAVRWYVDGFAERSKVEVKMELSDDLGRLPTDVETTIFRIIQECLTNIHRHSGSPTADIRIWRTPQDVNVEIRDSGTGIPLDKQHTITTEKAGVGIRGMKGRIRQLGGKLEIAAGNPGTKVSVCLPVGHKTEGQEQAAGA